MKPLISLDEFMRVDLRIGKVLQAEEVAESKKLLKLRVDIGGEERQLLAGIKGHYTAEQMTGRLIVVVVNLQPRTMMGLESQGMMLAANDGNAPILIAPISAVPPGTTVR